MTFPIEYLCLSKSSFFIEDYSIVPIRYEDRLDIMNWRNEQVYHLRQDKKLTQVDQENYFLKTIKPLFSEEKPNQLLFSYLKGETCIGYGGLVHLNWVDRNAEISFIMNTSLEKTAFQFHWKTFLNRIEEVAFNILNFHKIFTYAFDLRPRLYDSLEQCDYKKEAILKEHCLFENNYIDVIIHSKTNRYLSLRKIEKNDVIYLYNLANESQARENSFQSKKITLEKHKIWFQNKLLDEKSNYYICQINKEDAGLIRFDIGSEDNAVIGINIDANFRGSKVSSKFLKIACNMFLKENSNPIFAYIKKSNIASSKSFERAGFIFNKEVKINEELANLYRYESK
ncbi:RimJ/RimL family protein N-acetyltransferase [Lutibacter sp. Hel_I_33_5]|uniref:GNAT family N-acetyltransferase n=1 Tax=Lutibacter sp. Hel_I_33_5 TaxID=1566289 RepID=UPI00119CA2AC|nr:GNAT family N-acetyltransferase [Lutibacter sp. Hel_I_33_5]TVZ56193.1 RimJ/RimL family protein N-acetyltransferase [Lutibacter sp. Hel_I_33_5]